MKEKNETAKFSKDLEKILSHGKIPKNIDNFRNNMKQLHEAQKLKDKGAQSEEILSLFEKNTNIDEVEKGLLFYRFFLDNKDLFKEVIEINKGKSTKFRQSGHLTDQALKYTEPRKSQPNLFDLISPETKGKLESPEIEIKAEGIRLSPSEDKMLKALSKLMEEKNIIRDINTDHSNNNGTYQVTTYGGNGQMAKAPILKISPSELYKAYLDKDDYSGEEIKHIKKVLHDFSQKKFLIIYDRKRVENGKKLTDRIEDCQNLIKIMSYIEGLSESELEKLNSGDVDIREKRGELIICLNPIFVDQINTKYIEYPTDINKRTSIAAGGHYCVSESMIVLRDYMLREMSAKRYSVQINDERLPYILHLEKYISRRKKKIVTERIEGAIKAVKNMGIILDVQQSIGANGQVKHTFLLNEDFE